MRTLVRLLAGLAIVLAGVACAGGAPSPSPTTAPTPVASVPPSGLFLRATMTQAIPPLARFGWLPVVAITLDGTVVVPGPAVELFPGPLVPSLTGRSISDAGLARILAAARDLGLLSGTTDFSGGSAIPGAQLGRLQLVVDGRPVELTGDPSRLVRCGETRCVPTPGTPEAFAAFWQQLTQLATWMPGELGPETPYVAPAYALLVGPARTDGPAAAPVDWPLTAPLAKLGTRVGDQGERCVTIGGLDADALGPALAAANETTAWVQDPSTSATFGLTVRPLLPGEDACRELFGVEG